VTQATLSAARGGFRAATPVLLMAAAFFGGLAIFVVYTGLGVRGYDSGVLGLAVVTGLVALIPLILDQGRQPMERHLLFTLTCLGFAVFFVQPVFTSYLLAPKDVFVIGGGFTYLPHIRPTDIMLGQLASLLGLLAMLGGYAIPLGRRVAHLLPQPQREWSHGATLGAALVMIPAGWVILIGGQLGFVPAWLGSGLLGAVGSSVYFGTALLTLAHIRYRSWPALLFLVLILPPTMAALFFTGSKSIFLAPAVMIVIARLLVLRRIKLRYLAVGFFAVVLVYPVAQFFREVIQPQSGGMVSLMLDPAWALSMMSKFVAQTKFSDYVSSGASAFSHRFNALGITAVIVRDTPDRVPYQGGWSLGYILLSYVPRALWPGKPVFEIGQWVTNNFGSGPHIRSATGPSWIGELFFNFGFPGVVVGMALIGVYVRVLHDLLFRRDSPIPALMMGIVALYCLIWRMGGGLLAPINGVIFSAMPLIAMHYLVKTFTPPPRVPPPPLA